MEVVASTQTAAALGEGDGRIPIANPVAAVPSMHAALPVLLLLFLWSRARRLLRVLLVSYAALMGFVLVYTGEHFVFDILAGWACAAVVHVLVTAYERRRRTGLQAARHGGTDPLDESRSPAPADALLTGPVLR
jgi:hypothetical protein